MADEQRTWVASFIIYIFIGFVGSLEYLYAYSYSDDQLITVAKTINTFMHVQLYISTLCSILIFSKTVTSFASLSFTLVRVNIYACKIVQTV